MGWNEKKAALAAGLGLAIGVVSCGNDEPKEEPIIIGFVESLSGESAFVSSSLEQAATVATQHINEAGGINGRPLKLRTLDNKDDVETTRAHTRQLLEDDVQYLIVGTSGDHLNAMAELTVPAERLVLTGLPYGDSYNGPHRNDLMVRTTTLGEGYIRAWTEQIRSEHQRILLVDSEGELAKSDGVAKRMQAEFESQGCGDDPCELSILSHPDEADVSYDWSGLAEEAEKARATTVVFLHLDTDLFIQAIQASSGFEGTWHMQPHHSFAPLPQVLAPELLQRLRWANLAVPETPSSQDLSSALGVDASSINPSAAATYDLVILLGLALSRSDSLGARDAALAMREVSRGPGERIHSVDLKRAFDDPELMVDYFGASGPVDLNELGDVLSPGIVVQRFDSSGSVVNTD